MDHKGSSQRYLDGVQYSIDFITALLLFTGQISTSGIFVVPDGFQLAMTGPIFGGVTLQGVNRNWDVVGAAVDRIVAILLILNVIRVTGPYITSGRFFLVVAGEIFGIKEIAGAVPLSAMNPREASSVARFIKRAVIRRTEGNRR
ncbi:hypothetical protein JZ785_26650 [Alicyclobacillus curvatus]|jgi:hypothetical protein|nr:hypothetical protein JZ785_26650 [Alicyclobacillus curvatus]